jgi:predicted nucleic-acid-binding Zn-ribbon protein
MKKLVSAVKAGVKGVAQGMGPGSYSAGGIRVVCPHCKNDTFDQHEAQLNTPVATFLNLDWTNKTGTALICANCGLIQWFGKEPQRI